MKEARKDVKEGKKKAANKKKKSKKSGLLDNTANDFLDDLLRVSKTAEEIKLNLVFSRLKAED